jgi:multiple sugar transport system ATP-binding protein
MNLAAVPVAAGGVELDELAVPLPRATLDAAGAAGLNEVTLGIRPEALRLLGEGEGEGEAGLTMTVELVEELGADAFVYGEARIGSEPRRVIVRTSGAEVPAFGEMVRVGLRGQGRTHVFHPVSGERLPD